MNNRTYFNRPRGTGAPVVVVSRQSSVVSRQSSVVSRSAVNSAEVSRYIPHDNLVRTPSLRPRSSVHRTTSSTNAESVHATHVGARMLVAGLATMVPSFANATPSHTLTTASIGGFFDSAIRIVIEIGFGLWMLFTVLNYFGLDEPLLELARGAGKLITGHSKGKHVRQERRAVALMERKKFAEAAVIYRGLMKHRIGVGDSMGAVRDAKLAIRAYERAGAGEHTDDILISLEDHLESVVGTAITTPKKSKKRGAVAAKNVQHDLRAQAFADVSVQRGLQLLRSGDDVLGAAQKFRTAQSVYERLGLGELTAKAGMLRLAAVRRATQFGVDVKAGAALLQDRAPAVRPEGVGALPSAREQGERLLLERRWEDAVTALSIALGEARARGDLRTAGDVAVSLGTALRELGRHEKSAEMFDEAMQSFETAGNQAMAAAMVAPVDLSDGGLGDTAEGGDGSAEAGGSKVT